MNEKAQFQLEAGGGFLLHPVVPGRRLQRGRGGHCAGHRRDGQCVRRCPPGKCDKIRHHGQSAVHPVGADGKAGGRPDGRGDGLLDRPQRAGGKLPGIPAEPLPVPQRQDPRGEEGPGCVPHLHPAVYRQLHGKQPDRGGRGAVPVRGL